MSSQSSYVRSLFLLGLPLAIALDAPASAQGICPYATLQIDSIQYVDQAAVCEAAKPWADDGYKVLVFLTDARPETEDAWFNLLDSVEAEAGLRDLTQTDSFERAAIALEATTATDLPYAVSITYGETLYNTPLDTDDAALEGIKRSVREKIATQDATWGLTAGLQEMAALVGVPTSSAEVGGPNSVTSPLSSSDIGQGTTVTATNDSGGAIMAGGWLTLLGGGTVGIVALQRRRRKQLNAHLETLQNRIANLLMWCEQLLTGGAPENTLPYQLFSESDGERYPELTQQVKTRLAEARQALDQAFQVHAHLQEDPLQLKLPLVKRVEAWEMLYLAFVGKYDRILNMSDDELRTLLNPAVVLNKHQTQVSQGLVSHLEAIQGKIKDTPLKVALKQAKPKQIDHYGILGRIERVDHTIGHLQWAVTAAPETLAATRARRQTLETLLPNSLGLPAIEAFCGIDRCIAAAETTLTRDRLYLKVVEDCRNIEQVMNWMATLSETFQRYDDQQAEIQAITQVGYRPPQLHDHQATLEHILEQLRQQLREGSYSAIPGLLSQLAEASTQAQETATIWRDHHQHNQHALKDLTAEHNRLVSLSQQKATAAWQTIQHYPASNWTDLASALDDANQILQQAYEKTFPYLHQQNDFPMQALAEVSQEIETLKSQLENAEILLQSILTRQQLIQSAEVHLSRELAEVETYIQQTTQFVTVRFLGIFAASQPDPRLQEAQAEIDVARHRAQDQEYFRACAARDQALRLVLFVYLAKLVQEAGRVRSLVMDFDARGQGRTDLDQATKLMTHDAAIRQATGQALFTQYANAGQARQALQTAERLARKAIHRTKAARKRSSSSSSYSAASSRSSSSSHRSRSSSSRRSASSSSRRSSSSRGSSRRR